MGRRFPDNFLFFPPHLDAWNNGKEVPRWGVAEIQKMSPSTMGDVIVVTNSPPIGHMRSQLTNHQVGIVLDVQAWSEKLY